MDGLNNYHFKDLEDNEEIIKVVHRNWFYIFEQFLMLILVLGIFIGATVAVPIFYPNILASANQNFILFAQNFFMLAIWIYGFMIWIDYYFDVWIVTSERVVNIEQKGLFTRKVSELRYNKIEDVTVEVIGFIPTMINYGDIQIQTAAEEEEFRFRTVSDPYHLKNLIMDMQKKAETHSTEELGEMIKEKISG